MAEDIRELREAEALDTLLDSLPAPAPPGTALIARLMDIPGSQPRTQNAGRSNVGIGVSVGKILSDLFRPRLLPQAAGLVLAGAMGIMLGLSGVDRPSGPIAVFDASAYMFGDPGLLRDLEDID